MEKLITAIGLLLGIAILALLASKISTRLEIMSLLIAAAFAFAGLAFIIGTRLCAGEVDGQPVPRRLADVVRRIAQTAAVLVAGIALLAATRPLYIGRLTGKSAISLGNLRVIHSALELYHRDYGAYPPSLARLVELDLCTPGYVVYRYDPTYRGAPSPGAGYSSYVYQPGSGPWLSDPRVLLAHERLPWSYGQVSWCCPPGYTVLFADGTVRWLTIDEMAAAQRIDAERRLEIGWPNSPLLAATSGSASQPALR